MPSCTALPHPSCQHRALPTPLCSGEQAEAIEKEGIRPDVFLLINVSVPCMLSRLELVHLLPPRQVSAHQMSSSGFLASPHSMTNGHAPVVLCRFPMSF